ncbi:integrase domain protein [Escherichia coli DEC2E]|nr:integrase domain protein [Escherichia coli DEC2E]
MSLTDTKVKNARPAEKAVKLTDGFGLYLLLHPNGSKYWQLGYRFDGKQKVFSIGVYPAVSLADARQRRDEAKSCLLRESILTLKNRLMKKLCMKSGIKPVRSVSSPEAGLPPKQNGLKITPIRYGSALRPMYSRILVTATFQIWIRVICLFR